MNKDNMVTIANHILDLEKRIKDMRGDCEFYRERADKMQKAVDCLKSLLKDEK